MKKLILLSALLLSLTMFAQTEKKKKFDFKKIHLYTGYSIPLTNVANSSYWKQTNFKFELKYSAKDVGIGIGNKFQFAQENKKFILPNKIYFFVTYKIF